MSVCECGWSWTYKVINSSAEVMSWYWGLWICKVLVSNIINDAYLKQWRHWESSINTLERWCRIYFHIVFTQKLLVSLFSRWCRITLKIYMFLRMRRTTHGVLDVCLRAVSLMCVNTVMISAALRRDACGCGCHGDDDDDDHSSYLRRTRRRSSRVDWSGFRRSYRVCSDR